MADWSLPEADVAGWLWIDRYGSNQKNFGSAHHSAYPSLEYIGTLGPRFRTQLA